MPRNNKTWIADLSRGGPAGQEALTTLRESLLRGLRRSFAGRPEADESFLEDTVQDSLVRILERIDQFEDRSRFLTWATSIAIRIAMSELRRKRWQDVSLEAVVSDADRSLEWPADHATPERQAEQNAILEAMRLVIHTKLTEKQRTALLAELKGMPQDEIARHLGGNRNAVYKLTHDARKRLKNELQHIGYGKDDVSAAFVN